MSIQVAKEVHCDTCGEWVRSYSSRIQDIWTELRREGWIRKNGYHYCGVCVAANLHKQEL